MPPPLTDAERDSLRAPLRTLRIIVFALMMGVTSFAAVSIFLKLQQGQPQPGLAQPNGMAILHIAAMLFGGIAAALALVFPPFLRLPPVEAEKPDARNDAVQAAAGVVQTRTIIAAALLEGAAFFNLIWFFLDVSYPNLAMAGVLLLLILMHFPLTSWYFDKIERLIGVDPFAAKWDRT